jgi:hypothetical protein
VNISVSSSLQFALNVELCEGRNDEVTIRHVCTSDDSWTSDMNCRAIHPDAINVSEDYGWYSTDGDLEGYQCLHCKLDFTVELGT